MSDMLNFATKQDMSNLDIKIDKVLAAVERLSKKTDQQFFMVDQRFKVVESDIAELKQSQDRILSTLDGFAGMAIRNSSEQAVGDHRLNRLVAWSKKVSVKVDVPLEGL